MSLIHQALKKSEDSKFIGNGGKFSRLQPTNKSSAEKKNKRTAVLIAILILAMLFAVYTNFIASRPKKVLPAKTNLPAPAGALTESHYEGLEVSRLKNQAKELFDAGKSDAAFSLMTTAMEVKSDDPEVLNNLALLLKKKGDFEKAETYFAKALALKPDYAECMANFAALEIARGNMAKAEKFLISALKINPKISQAHYHLAVIAEAGGEKDRAIRHYKEFLDNSDDVPQDFVEEVKRHAAELP